MERVPILRIGSTLLVSIQVDLQDQSVQQLQEDVAEQIAATGAKGVIIDITAVEIVDSFIGRMLSMIGSMSRLFDAQTVLVGMRPAVAITLVELGLSLDGVQTALNTEKGLRLLARSVLMDELPIGAGDDVVRVRQQVRAAAAEAGMSLIDQTKAGHGGQRAGPQHAGPRRGRRGADREGHLRGRPGRGPGRLRGQRPRHRRSGPGPDRRLDHRHGPGPGPVGRPAAGR